MKKGEEKVGVDATGRMGGGGGRMLWVERWKKFTNEEYFCTTLLIF